MSIPFFRDPNQVLIPNIPRSTVVVTQPRAFTPPPPASEWTWANQNNATIRDIPGALELTINPGNVNSLGVLLKGELPDVPYTITFVADSTFGQGIQGIVLLDTVSGKIKLSITGSINYSDDFNTFNSIAPADNASFPANSTAGTFTWLRVQDDGVNLVSSYSSNGVYYVPGTIVARDDFVIPTHYGLGFFPTESNPPYPEIETPRLIHFELTIP